MHYSIFLNTMHSPTKKLKYACFPQNRSMFSHVSLLLCPFYNLYTWKLNHDVIIWNKKWGVIRNILGNTLGIYQKKNLTPKQTPLWGKCESPLTFPKMGLRSPSGFLKIQNAIIGVKTPCIDVFFIPLERFWSVDVQNGLTWAIWTYATQVIVERKAGSQIDNLTPDH